MTAMTHSQLAATLFVDGCLANVAGAVRGAAPIEPVVLTELERNDIGLKQGGHTLFYPLPPSGVFVCPRPGGALRPGSMRPKALRGVR